MSKRIYFGSMTAKTLSRIIAMFVLIIALGDSRDVEAQKPCSYSVENYPPNWIFDGNGGEGLIEIDASNGCCWSVSTPNSDWIQIPSGFGSSSGCGSGEVAYAVQSATVAGTRTGTVYVDGHTFTITQMQSQPCSYSVENYPPNWIFDQKGGEGLIEIDASNECCWSVSTPNSDWISIPWGGSSSGCGRGEVTYAVQNWSFNCYGGALTRRTGTVYVDGRAFSIIQTQSQPYCSVEIGIQIGGYVYPISQFQFDPSGGDEHLEITDTNNCCWSVQNSNNWIYVSESSGSYSTGIDFYVGPNFTGLTQTGIVVIGTQTLTVVQPSVACSLPPSCGISIAPTNQTIGGSACSFTISVTATSSCCWSVQNSNAWISVSPSSGWTSESISCSVNPNFTGLSRTGTLVVATQEITVVQPTATVSSNLVILQAWYGANGGTTNNVLSIIQANIVSNTVNMSIGNGTMGGDPAPGHVKTFYVLYQNDAGLFQQTLQEGGTLHIPNCSAQQLPPQLLSATMSGGNFTMSFATISNVNYIVQANLDLTTTNWFDLTNFTGIDLVAPVTFPISNGVPQEFFRVRQ